MSGKPHFCNMVVSITCAADLILILYFIIFIIFIIRKVRMANYISLANFRNNPLYPPFSGRQKDVPQKTGTRLNCITFFIFFIYFSLLPVFWGTSFFRPEKGGLLF